MVVTKKETSKKIPYLHDEIIEDILVRMTAREVLRCHCLSRTWATVLSSKAFTNRHLVLANRGNGPKIVISPGPGRYNNVLVWSLENPNGTPVFYFPNSRISCVRGMTNPCHGLILLHAQEGKFYVCNPSIREIKLLPPFGINIHNYGTFGLGYDQLTKEYKVVRLCLNSWTNDFTGCEIFTINPMGHWKPVADDRMPPVSNVWWSNRGIFAQGYVHWLVWTRDLDNAACFIVSFSLGDETFGLLQPPDDPHIKYNFEITEVNGCLCLFYIDNYWKETKIYDLWILRDYDARVWELLCHIDATCSIPEVDLFDWCCTISPLAFLEDARRILFLFYRRGSNYDKIKCMLVTYSNLDHQMSAYYPVESRALGDFATDDDRQIWLYEDSLVRVPQLIPETSKACDAADDIDNYYY